MVRHGDGREDRAGAMPARRRRLLGPDPRREGRAGSSAARRARDARPSKAEESVEIRGKPLSLA